MKWCAALVLALTTTAIAAPPPKPAAPARKPASLAYPLEALAPFVEAIVADKAGDLSLASNLYRKSLRSSDQANTHYNLASVLHRLEYFSQAIDSYRKYLALAPDATDRAVVENRIEQIEQRPSIAVIDGDDAGAVVVVDGKLVGPSPALIYPSPGGHVADRIGPASFAHRRFHAFEARTEHVRMRHVAATGNVVLVASPEITVSGRWEDRGHAFELPGRFALPPGRYSTVLRAPGRACEPLRFEVARGDHITYVYVGVQPDAPKRHCIAIRVTTLKVRLPR